jgi:hypothetical protein
LNESLASAYEIMPHFGLHGLLFLAALYLMRWADTTEDKLSYRFYPSSLYGQHLSKRNAFEQFKQVFNK